MSSLTQGFLQAIGRFMPPVEPPPSATENSRELAVVRRLNATAVADRDALLAQLPRATADNWVQQRTQLLRDVNDPAKAGEQKANRKRVNELDHELVTQLERHVDRNIMDKADRHPYIAVLKYADDGMIRMWRDHAKNYRDEAGLIDGWKTTAKMYAAMGVTLLRTQSAKASFERPRPYQTDDTIQQLGHLSIDTSYPSGHTANAHAAADVLADGWERLAAKRAAANDTSAASRSLVQARTVERDAHAIGLSRVSAGMHHASDVRLGAKMGDDD